MVVIGIKRILGRGEKNEVDLEHNSPHASGVFGRKITGEDDLSHHV